MELLVLNYVDDDFPVRARKLIGARRGFTFEVTGESFRQLAPHIRGNRLVDPAKLGLRPKLQVLLAVVMLAEGKGLATSFEVGDDSVLVVVGVGLA
jgi:hypothetical protein